MKLAGLRNRKKTIVIIINRLRQGMKIKIGSRNN